MNSPITLLKQCDETRRDHRCLRHFRKPPQTVVPGVANTLVTNNKCAFITFNSTEITHRRIDVGRVPFLFSAYFSTPPLISIYKSLLGLNGTATQLFGGITTPTPLPSDLFPNLSLPPPPNNDEEEKRKACVKFLLFINLLNFYAFINFAKRNLFI